MGDFNIDIKYKGLCYGKLDTFCDLSNLTNLIHSETCLMKNHKSTIDLFLTNKPKLFFKTYTTEAGLSDYHKLIATFFKSKAPKLKPKVIFHRNYKKFDEKSFLHDLRNKNFSMSSNDPNVNYKPITENFVEAIDKHAPLKKKLVRGNQVPFMNRDFQKAIYTRTRLKNKYWRDPSTENELAFKKQRNLCVSIRRKSITNYLNKFTDKGLEANKLFWKFIKPFLTNKSTLTDCDITIVDGKKIISDDFELAKTFNNHYINTVEIKSGFKPSKITNQSKDDILVIDEIIRTYQDHPSVKQIKNVIATSNTPKPIYFSFESTNPVEVQKCLKNIDLKKATGFDKIPPKLVKLSAEVLSTALSIAINNSLKYGVFPDDAKIASVIPLDKGKPNKNEISNFRPVSILNTFSKIYEKVIKDQLVSGLDKYLSPFISAYRKGYSTQHVLTRLVEEWRE